MDVSSADEHSSSSSQAVALKNSVTERRLSDPRGKREVGRIVIRDGDCKKKEMSSELGRHTYLLHQGKACITYDKSGEDCWERIEIAARSSMRKDKR